MSNRQLSWIVAASLHLALAVCGALCVPLNGDSLLLNLLGQYGDMSGSSSSYGFFAPAVASKSRVSLAVRDGHGNECGGALLADATSAADLRAGGIVDGFPGFSDALRRGLTASWASAMFGRHPSAEEVVVVVEIETLPTMAEWRNGKRSTWNPVYKGVFCRKEHGERPNHAK